jgi:predicted secreted protein
MENSIQNPLALIFDKDAHLFASTKQGTMFKMKVESDLVSLKGVVIAQIAIGCGLLYGLAILNDVLYVASHDDDECFQLTFKRRHSTRS